MKVILANDPELLQDAMQLPCAARHVFHEECVRSWLSRNVTCPLCRVDVERLVSKTFPACAAAIRFMLILEVSRALSSAH